MEWINVKDFLPDDGYDVLVTDGIACMVAVYRTSIQEWDFFDNTFWNTTEVTHWMPLPKPPKNG